MSFQDLESGRALTPLPGPRHIEQGASRALAAGVFRINTAVAGYKRLVNSIGTSRDTAELRQNLRKTRPQIGKLVKETSAELDRVRKTIKFGEVDASKKIADAKLTKDYESVLREFEKAQLLAAQKEKAFPSPVANSTRQPSNRASELEISSLSPMQASLVREANSSTSSLKRTEVMLLEKQVMHMESEIVLNEAIIEEREQGIKEIQEAIGVVNEVFRELAQIISTQGALIDDISSNIESSQAATSEAANQLVKASNIQRSSSSTTCLMVVIVGIILLIVVFVILS